MKTFLQLCCALVIGAYTLIAAASYLPPPPAPSVAAKSYMLVDFYSGQTLAELNMNQRVEPASLTKLMTAYLTFAAVKQNQLKLDQVIPVSERAWRSEGSRMFIEINKPVKVEELIRGMIVQSGNDACIALAEAIAGSEEVFAEMMNRQAQKLGMSNTHFMNSTGLPHPQHYTTAADLARLASAIIRDFPEFYPIYSMKDYTYNNIKQTNRNLLLWRDPYVDGMKTGHTETAGYCLIASVKRGDRRLISVVLGTASENIRATESLKLLNYGLQFYDTPRLYQAKQRVTTLPVWKGSANTLNIGFNRDIYLTIPKGQQSRLKANLLSQQPLIAPILGGQTVGKLQISLDSKLLGEYPVVALTQVPQANIFGRAWDSIKLWLN